MRWLSAGMAQGQDAVAITGDVGAWRSLVARLPWAQEVPGSNPGAPTKFLFVFNRMWKALFVA